MPLFVTMAATWPPFSLDGIIAREKQIPIWLVADTVMNDYELLLGIALIVNGVLLSLHME